MKSIFLFSLLLLSMASRCFSQVLQIKQSVAPITQKSPVVKPDTTATKNKMIDSKQSINSDASKFRKINTDFDMICNVSIKDAHTNQNENVHWLMQVFNGGVLAASTSQTGAVSNVKLNIEDKNAASGIAFPYVAPIPMPNGNPEDNIPGGTIQFTIDPPTSNGSTYVLATVVITIVYKNNPDHPLTLNCTSPPVSIAQKATATSHYNYSSTTKSYECMAL